MTTTQSMTEATAEAICKAMYPHIDWNNQALAFPKNLKGDFTTFAQAAQSAFLARAEVEGFVIVPKAASEKIDQLTARVSELETAISAHQCEFTEWSERQKQMYRPDGDTITPPKCHFCKAIEPCR